MTGLTVISPIWLRSASKFSGRRYRARSASVLLGCASGEPVGESQLRAVQSVADRMGLRLVPMLIHRVEELSGALENAIRKGIDAVLVFDCRVLTPPASVTGPLNKARLAAVYHAPRYVHASGLMSYGANSAVLYRRSATFVDKILKGARPADLPVEQPQKFELVINLKTANALGVTIPASLRARADEMIE